MPKDEEVLTAITVLESTKQGQLIRVMNKDYEHLPYRIDDLANRMSGAVRELCPPGFEIDR